MLLLDAVFDQHLGVAAGGGEAEVAWEEVRVVGVVEGASGGNCDAAGGGADCEREAGAAGGVGEGVGRR